MRIILSIAALALLSACNMNQSGAEAAVRDSLKDPDSAKFGEFYFNPETLKGCLAVNAKNSMGGYTGEQQAYLEKTKDGWQVYGITEIPLGSCRNVHADRKDD